MNVWVVAPFEWPLRSLGDVRSASEVMPSFGDNLAERCEWLRGTMGDSRARGPGSGRRVLCLAWEISACISPECLPRRGLHGVKSMSAGNGGWNPCCGSHRAGRAVSIPIYASWDRRFACGPCSGLHFARCGGTGSFSVQFRKAMVLKRGGMEMNGKRRRVTHSGLGEKRAVRQAFVISICSSVMDALSIHELSRQGKRVLDGAGWFLT